MNNELNIKMKGTY